MLLEKVKAVEELFEQLDGEIAAFQSWSTLKCASGCGRCCYKPDIEATILEFIPFAHFLYTHDRAYEWLNTISSSSATICMILDPGQTGVGLCSEYKHRGLICRLFGYSARTDKYNKAELVTCTVIKGEQTLAYESAALKVSKSAAIPVMNQFYMRLHGIDADLSREFFPINQAIKRAIEVILHYYAYRS
jgi:Fe-S-cluster containining protein